MRIPEKVKLFLNERSKAARNLPIGAKLRLNWGYAGLLSRGKCSALESGAENPTG